MFLCHSSPCEGMDELEVLVLVPFTSGQGCSLHACVPAALDSSLTLAMEVSLIRNSFRVMEIMI